MDRRLFVLVAVAVIAIFTLYQFDPIPQDTGYHDFSDTRLFFSIPNTMDVISNAGFLIVGILGIAHLIRQKKRDALWLSYFMFFFGVTLTAFGSGWYHLDPDNQTLVWDRLPMTIAFMSFFTSAMIVLVDRRAGTLLFPLIMIGISSVLYWSWTEHQGHGDLRFYAVIQFLPVILLPIMFILYRADRTYMYSVAGLFVFYLLSKLLEFFDRDIFELTAIISGHSLKHLSAATGTAMILVLCRKQYKIDETDIKRVLI